MNGENLVEGSPAAKQLGIYLGQLYGWVKAGKLTNYKPDGKYVVDDGKGLIVDIDDALAVWKSSSKKAPRDPNKPRAKKSSSRRTSGAAGEVGSEPKSRRLPAGTIVSWEKGHRPGADARLGKPSYTVAQVLASTGKLTFLDEGDHRRTYNGTLIDDIVFGTDRLSRMMARGVCRVEHPVPLLGMILLSFVMEGKVELAESLEEWMVTNELPVVVPELIDVDEEDEAEPIVRGAAVTGDDDE